MPYARGFLSRYQALQIVAAVLTVLMVPENAGAQQTGLCSPVQVPGTLGTTSEGINNAGAVVGSYTASDGSVHGYVYAGGQFTTLDAPDSLWTMAFGINDAGVVVGVRGPTVPLCDCVADLEIHGFRYSGGEFTTFDIGLAQTWPMAINNGGQIVGYYHDRHGDIQDNSRGFLLSAAGGLTRIDAPGGGPLSQVSTVVRGINDNGVAVGHYMSGTRVGFIWRNGVMSELRHPEAPDQTVLNGINTDEKIVGTLTPSDAVTGGQSFSFASQQFASFGCGEPDDESEPSAAAIALTIAAAPTITEARAINNKGAIVGSQYFDAIGSKGFLTRPITFVDPIPALATEGQTTITSNLEVLATRGRDVQAIAADGVSQVLVRIPMSTVHEVLTVTVYKSKTQSIGTTETKMYGALGVLPGGACPGSGCEAVEVTPTSVDTTSRGPMAFVLYRAPLDFARSSADENLAYRDVYLRVQGSTGSVMISLRVIRPPVALVHGLWSDKSLWDKFGPYVTRDPRFKFIAVDYGEAIRLESSQPSDFNLMSAKASALGVRYNAWTVETRVSLGIRHFKNGSNPVGLPAAAIQADFVTHSMGGLIARYLARLKPIDRYTMGHGLVHKLITIDTPHLGSPLASRFIQQIETWDLGIGCLRRALALPGNLVLKNGKLRAEPFVINGAIYDLRETPNSILSEIIEPTTRAVPTSFIAGRFDNWIALELAHVVTLRRVCALDAIAGSLSRTGWPVLMGDENDGVVTVTSQKAGLANPPVELFPGMGHSDALKVLGFLGEHVTSASAVAVRVLAMLNTPYTEQSFFTCLPQGQTCKQ